MILTTDFPALTDYLTSYFNEVSKTSIEKMVGNQVFQVKDTDRRSYDHLILHGLSVIRQVAQGADLPTTTIVQGDTISYVQARYGGIVAVTKDMRMFDLYDQIESIVKSTADDAFHKIDQSMADVLGRGFSASNYTDVYGTSVAATGPDGLALFSASHSNNINSTVFSNIITYGTVNPVISREAIVAERARAFNYIDPTGHNRPVEIDTLLVAPGNEDFGLRITNSDGMQGTADNDINPLKGKMKVKAWSKLNTRTGGTDTGAYWYLYDSSKVGETLKALFAERPSLDAPEQVYKNKNWDYSCDFYYVLGRGFMPYLRGSNASLA